MAQRKRGAGRVSDASPGELPRALRWALLDAARGRLPATLRPVLARRLALSLVLNEVTPRQLPPELREEVDAAVAKLRAGRWPGWHTFPRDRAALERLANEDEQGRTRAELLAAEQFAARYEAEADVATHQPGPAAFLRYGDQRAQDYVNRALGTDERRQAREVPLDEAPAEALAAPSPDVIRALDVAARLRALLASAGPRQRAILEAWRRALQRNPDASLAEVVRAMLPPDTPAAEVARAVNAAYQAIDRLRRRFG